MHYSTDIASSRCKWKASAVLEQEKTVHRIK